MKLMGGKPRYSTPQLTMHRDEYSASAVRSWRWRSEKSGKRYMIRRICPSSGSLLSMTFVIVVMVSRGGGGRDY